MGRSSSGRMGHLSRKAETLECEEALCGIWDESIPGRMNGKDAKLWGGRGVLYKVKHWQREQKAGAGCRVEGEDPSSLTLILQYRIIASCTEHLSCKHKCLCKELLPIYI